MADRTAMPTRAHAVGSRAPLEPGFRPPVFIPRPPNAQSKRDGESAQDSARGVPGVRRGGLSRGIRSAQQLGFVTGRWGLARTYASTPGGSGRSNWSGGSYSRSDRARGYPWALDGSAVRCEPPAAQPSTAAVRKPEQLDTRRPPGAGAPAEDGSSGRCRHTIGGWPPNGHPPALALRGTSESHPARICRREGLRTGRAPRDRGQAARPERVRVRALRWIRKARRSDGQA